jgi:hypothetical protein
MIKIISYKGDLYEKALEYGKLLLAKGGDEDNIHCITWEGYTEPFLWKINSKRSYSSYVKGHIEGNLFGDTIVCCPEIKTSNDEVARMADYVVQYYWNDMSTIAIVTTSQAFVNRIGRRVAEHNNLVYVIEVFTMSTFYPAPQRHTFDEKGALSDWPRGFFDPDDDGPIDLQKAQVDKEAIIRADTEEWLLRLVDGYKTVAEIKVDKEKVLKYCTEVLLPSTPKWSSGIRETFITRILPYLEQL